MGIHTKTLMVTGSASISGSLHFDGVLPANLVVGSDTNADRKITFGHTNLKSVIGLDSNGATTKFAINTDPDFADAYNDLEIDLAGNVYLHNGDLYVRGGDIYGIENGQLRLHSDTDIVLKLDADNDSSSEFRINDGGGSTKFSVDESGNTHIEGTMRIDGNSILASDAGTPIQWDTSDNVTIGGDITIGGNDIRYSEGTITMTLDSDEDVTFASHIMMGNNKELRGISNVTLNYDQDNNGSGNLNIKSGGTIVMSINNAGVIETMPAIGGSTPTLTIGDGDDEDVKIILDNSGQDYYLGTDRSDSDKLKIGTGTGVGQNGTVSIEVASDETLAVYKGFRSAMGVEVAGRASDGAGEWVKVLESTSALAGNAAVEFTALIFVTPMGYLTTDASSQVYLVTGRWSSNNSNQVSTDNTWVRCTQINGNTRTEPFDPAENLRLTYNGVSSAELWIQGETNYSSCHATIIGGHALDADGESWSSPGFKVSEKAADDWGSFVDLGAYASGEWSQSDLYGNDGYFESRGTSDTPIIRIQSNNTSDSAGGEIQFRKYQTEIVDGTNLGEIWFFGSENNTNWGEGAVIFVEANEAWSNGSAQGTRMIFSLCKDGAGSRTDKMKIDGNAVYIYGGDEVASNTGGDLIVGRSNRDGAHMAIDANEIEVYSNSTTGTSLLLNYNEGGDVTIGTGTLNSAGAIAIAGTGDSYITGQLGVGTSAPTAQVHIQPLSSSEIGLLVDGSSSGSSAIPVARFISDDTTMANTQAVVEIDSADTTMTSSNYYIEFTQNNSIVGSINSEVLYSTFTGGHSVKMVGDIPRRGAIIKSTGTPFHRYAGISNVMMEGTVCTQEKDKAAIGAFNGLWCTESEISGIIGEGCGDIHIYNALGEGQILVSDSGGNIEVGDYICSSNRAGHGMKQDDDLLHNYTVAKALEPVDFSNVEVDAELGFKSILVACTYHGA